MNNELRGIGRLNLLTAVILGVVLTALALTLAWLNFTQTAERQFNAESSKLREAIVHGLAGGDPDDAHTVRRRRGGERFQHDQ